jgi:lysophospholipase L1-like esterase
MFTQNNFGAYVPPLCITCFGDSTVEGNDTPQYAWPLQLSGYASFLNIVNVVNLGANGTLSSYPTSIYPTKAANYAPNFTHRAAMAIIQTGANDFPQNYEGTTTFSNVQNFVSALTLAGWLVGVVIPWSPVPGALTDEQVAQFTNYQNLLPTLTGTAFIYDANAVFTTPGSGPYFESSGNYHLSQSGYAKEASDLAALIQMDGFLSM